MLSAYPTRVPALQFAYLESARGIRIQCKEARSKLGMECRAFLEFGCCWTDWRGAYKNPGDSWATLIERLIEAEKAWHGLMTGQAVVAVYDSNGERVEFRPANRDALRLYILDLKSQIAGASKLARMTQFQTSKGV